MSAHLTGVVQCGFGGLRAQDGGVGLGWLVALGWLISASLAAVEGGWIITGARRAAEGEERRSN